jgi:hypothetical protein
MAETCDELIAFYERFLPCNSAIDAEILEKLPLKIIFGAHNGFKADYPLIKKRLLADKCLFK